MQEPLAFFDGRWIPASAAAVSVSDAGFILGATVAEQLRTFAGKIFHLDDHLARLAQSLEIVGLQPGMTLEQFARTRPRVGRSQSCPLAARRRFGIVDLCHPRRLSDLRRNKADRRLADDRFAEPAVCLHTYPLPFHRWAERYREGQALATTDVEQVSPRCWPPSLKCRSRMHYYLADRQAAARDPQARALLLDGARLRDRGLYGQRADLPCRRRSGVAADQEGIARDQPRGRGGTGPAARHPLRRARSDAPTTWRRPTRRC